MNLTFEPKSTPPEVGWTGPTNWPSDFWVLAGRVKHNSSILGWICRQKHWTEWHFVSVEVRNAWTAAEIRQIAEMIEAQNAKGI